LRLERLALAGGHGVGRHQNLVAGPSSGGELLPEVLPRELLDVLATEQAPRLIALQVAEVRPGDLDRRDDPGVLLGVLLGRPLGALADLNVQCLHLGGAVVAPQHRELQGRVETYHRAIYPEAYAHAVAGRKGAWGGGGSLVTKSTTEDRVW